MAQTGHAGWTTGLGLGTKPTRQSSLGAYSMCYFKIPGPAQILATFAITILGCSQNTHLVKVINIMKQYAVFNFLHKYDSADIALEQCCPLPIGSSAVWVMCRLDKSMLE